MHGKPTKSHLAVQPLSGRLPGLDALRGIAALCVLYFHLIYHLTPFPELKGRGYLAVDFFFMLSGYVMARTYEHRFASGYGILRFMRARYWRLWPVMAVGALIGTPLVLADMHYSQQAFIIVGANLLLLPSYGIQVLYPTNFVAWSIVGELAANLFHVTLAWRWRTSLVALGALLLLPAVVWYALSFGSLDFGISRNGATGGIVRALFAYSVGIVLFRWWRDEPVLRIHPAFAFATMPALMVLSQVISSPAWIFDTAFVVIVCPLLIAGGLAFRRDHWAATWLGMISFPLYAVHGPILQWAQRLGLDVITGGMVALALTILLALLTDPMAGWRGRKLAKAKGRHEVE